MRFTLTLAFTSPNPQTFTTDDTFALSLYDNSFGPQLSNGNEGDAIFTINLHANGTTTLNNASSAGQVTIQAVPEPATLPACLSAGTALWAMGRRRRVDGLS